MRIFSTTLAIVVGFAATCAQANDPRKLSEADLGGTGAHQLTAEIWVDNWFAAHLNGAPLHQDSVAYETERSFNAERITFKTDLPATLAFEFRDFMENETGLEYIGSRKQQMGDGGAIVQVRDAAGKTIAVTDDSWKCLVVQRAPLGLTCEKSRDPQPGVGDCAAKSTSVPADWAAPGFDDSSWPNATAHSASAVRPKDGYDLIRWDSPAQLIWGADLERDNILLCRVTLNN